MELGEGSQLFFCGLDYRSLHKFWVLREVAQNEIYGDCRRKVQSPAQSCSTILYKYRIIIVVLF